MKLRSYMCVAALLTVMTPGLAAQQPQPATASYSRCRSES